MSTVLNLNPGSVYLSLARHALLVETPASASLWWRGDRVGVVGLLAMSFLYFWRGEEQYGNV